MRKEWLIGSSLSQMKSMKKAINCNISANDKENTAEFRTDFWHANKRKRSYGTGQ